VGFVAIHLLLAAGSFDILDVEEQEYGNLTVALIDGNAADFGAFRTMDREGAMLVLGPVMVPFYLLFGSTMWAMRVFAVAAMGIWAVLWFLLACRTARAAPPWLVGAFFVLPIPLIGRAAFSSTSLATHLGASTWLALGLLCVLAAAKAESRWARIGGLVAAGGIASLGVICGYTFVALAPGLLFLAWRLCGKSGLLLVCLFALPGAFTTLGVADLASWGGEQDLVEHLTGLSPSSGREREGGIGTVLENLRTAAIYGPGFARPGEGVGWTPLAWGGLWTLLAFVGVGLAAVRHREPLPEESRPLAAALGVSTASYLVVFVIAGFRLDASYFDGLRYLGPLVPFGLVLLLEALGRSGRVGRALGALLLALQVAGFGFLFRAEVFPAPWSDLQGYTAPDPTVQLGAPLDMHGVPASRQDHWALWAGARVADFGLHDGTFEELEANRALHGLPDSAAAEFWRGVGMAQALAPPSCLLAGVCSVSGATPEVQTWLWQGAAMAVSCPDQEWLLRERGPAHPPEVAYGIGRLNAVCAQTRSPDEPLGIERSAAFKAGRLDGWRIDLAAPGAVQDAVPDWLDPLRPPISPFHMGGIELSVPLPEGAE